MKRLLVALGCLTFPVSPFPRPTGSPLGFPGLSAQKRAITIDDYLALKAVGNPQLSPDGKWVAYTVTEQSLKDNRGITRIWLAEVATGSTRQLTAGPGSDRQPRWSPDGRTLAFVSTRENGAQLWVLPAVGGGGEARRVTSLPDGVSDPLWLPDGAALIVTSDIKWPAQQEIDRRNGDLPTDARLWTGLLWRHWDDWRAGKRQHLFAVTLSDGSTRDVTPIDHDVPTIATGGDGDVSVSPDGKEIAVAMHGDSTVADNTNVDVFIMGPDGSAMRALTAGRGADNTPRFSPDGKWLAYLSMERAGFEADRQRLMIVRRNDGTTESGAPVEVTAGWTLSVGSYAWCPDSKCIFAVVEERGRDNIYRIEVSSFRRSLAVGASGVYSAVNIAPDGSTGYGQKFTDAISQHWGDYPYQDLMKGLDVVARLPCVDSTRMGAAGASYGGYMIYWIAGHTGRFKTLIAHDGVFNPVSMAGTTEELWFMDWEFGGTPYANRALYEKWSPLNFVQNWKTPILIVHSQLDFRVDPSEGYPAFTAAKLHGVPAKFLYFPDEGHWVLRPRNRRLWWGTVLDWIDQYLKPAPTGAGAR